jgi:hypothetical protein
MFSEPQTVTINAVAQTLPRTGTGPTSGVFTKEDGSVKLTVSHQNGKRNRRTIRLSSRKVAADPLATGVFQEVDMSAYLVVDHPLVGFSNTEVKQIVDALTGYLTASSGARVTQLLGGES